MPSSLRRLNVEPYSDAGVFRTPEAAVACVQYATSSRQFAAIGQKLVDLQYSDQRLRLRLSSGAIEIEAKASGPEVSYSETGDEGKPLFSSNKAIVTMCWPSGNDYDWDREQLAKHVIGRVLQKVSTTGTEYFLDFGDGDEYSLMCSVARDKSTDGPVLLWSVELPKGAGGVG
jgi:hypothetical protein